jgi:uncharacterized protein DUF4293
MIQRLQTLWLLLGAFFTALTFKFPFYTGSIMNGSNQLYSAKLSAQFNLLSLILTSVLLAIIVVDIFLFKNRKLQLRLAILALIISIADMIYYFSKIKVFANGELSLASLFYFLVPIILFLAARGIWRDQKLIKSLDRLR